MEKEVCIMKKRVSILVALLVVVLMSVTAQKTGRQMLINYGGEVVAAYELSKVDSVTFETYNIYRVTAVSSNNSLGTVSTSSEEVKQGNTATLTATPNEGCIFVNWTVNGKVVSTANPYTATITANTEFVANFEYYLSEPTGIENGYGYVDLGLSVKWATCNVGANSPEEYGGYFAWGETEPKNLFYWTNYKYCTGIDPDHLMTKYCTDSSSGTVDNKITLDFEDDAAYVNWGNKWRMPTTDEYNELMDANNCTWRWTTQNGVNGYKVISKINGNSIFLPAAGERSYALLGEVGDEGLYWSRSLVTGNNYHAYNLQFSSSWMYLRDISYRMYGYQVRAVYDSTPNVSVSATEGGKVESSAVEVEEGGTVTLTATPNTGYYFVNWTVNGEVVSSDNPYTATITFPTEYVANFEKQSITGTENGYGYVDLGLSVKWATCNVGASSPEEYGDYFAWGETETKDDYSWANYKYCNGNANSMTKYCLELNHGMVDDKEVLDLEDDAARVNCGGNWRMPTKAEQEELMNTSNCTWTWTTQNGVNGYKVTSNINGNFIFLPAAGYRSYDSLSYASSDGEYWSNCLYSDGSSSAYFLDFSSSYVEWNAYARFYGKTVRAVCESLTPIIYTVSVSATEGGEVDASAVEVEEGGTVTLTATPNTGYYFANWTVNGEVVSTQNSYTATVTANTEYVANFDKPSITGTENGYSYVDLGLSVKWATCNVGANSPEEYGDFFAWGEISPKDNYSWSTYKYCNGDAKSITKYCKESGCGTVDNKETLDLEDDVARVNWGGNWRMPTIIELHELAYNCTWESSSQNGVNGSKVTSKINGNSIFLPAAGWSGDGNTCDVGENGFYWSNYLSPYGSADAWGFGSDLNGKYFEGYLSRYYGLSVRPVCE